MAGGQDPAALDRLAAAMRVAGSLMRLQILAAVGEKGVMSPSDFAEAEDVMLREAAYHFRELRDGGLVLLEELTTTGGTAQHFYSLSPMGKLIVAAMPEWAKAAPPKRRRGKPPA